MIYVTNCNIGLTGGGDAVVAMEILNSLQSSEFDVASISRRHNIPNYLSESFSNIENFIFPFLPQREKYSNKKFGSLRYFLKMTQSSFYLVLLKRQLRKSPPTLCICNDLEISRYLLDEYQNQIKIIQVVHSLPIFYEHFKDEKLEVFFDTFDRADRIVFVSKESREKWLAYNRIDESKTHCIHNCANEKLGKNILGTPKSEVRKKLNMRSGKFYLIAVASFNYEKGLDLLIEAAPELKKIAPNLEILIIGADKAKYAEYLKEETKDESLDYLNLLGFKSNAMEFIYASDSFILPSRVESFPLVILESMILKTPVLATTVGGIPEMIDHDKTGLLFESENMDELIECFKSMYQNKIDRARYADHASKKYWDTFSKEKFTERYAELVNTMQDAG